MAEILARCGYRCDLCPGYVDNIKSDEDRQRVSDGWFKYIGVRVPLEEIGCRGCLEKEEPADQDCPVRPCVQEKGLDNCGYCREFPCSKLNTRMNFFENRFGDLLSTIPKDDFDKFIKPYISKGRLTKIYFEIIEGKDD